MKKALGIIAVIVVVAAVVIGGLVYLNVQKDKNSVADFDTENVDLSTLVPADPSSLQPIRLLNSEDVVYIEGISAEDAANIDLVLRHYEETDGEAETDGSLAWIYNQLQPVIVNWFDPTFDLIGAFNAVEHTVESDGTMAWLSVPLSQNLAANAENSSELFYYVYDEELGGYRMSAGYYLLGYAYSGMEPLLASANVE